MTSGGQVKAFTWLVIGCKLDKWHCRAHTSQVEFLLGSNFHQVSHKQYAVQRFLVAMAGKSRGFDNDIAWNFLSLGNFWKPVQI